MKNLILLLIIFPSFAQAFNINNALTKPWTYEYQLLHPQDSLETKPLSPEESTDSPETLKVKQRVHQEAWHRLLIIQAGLGIIFLFLCICRFIFTRE